MAWSDAARAASAKARGAKAKGAAQRTANERAAVASWRGSPVKPNTGILSGSASRGIPQGTLEQQVAAMRGVPGMRKSPAAAAEARAAGAKPKRGTAARTGLTKPTGAPKKRRGNAYAPPRKVAGASFRGGQATERVSRQQVKAAPAKRVAGNTRLKAATGAYKAGIAVAKSKKGQHPYAPQNVGGIRKSALRGK